MPTYIKTKKPKRKQSETESRTMNKNNIKKLGSQNKNTRTLLKQIPKIWANFLILVRTGGLTLMIAWK
jgi:hypothetical protein